MHAEKLDRATKDLIARAYRPSGPLHQRVPCPVCSPHRKPGNRNLPVLALTEGHEPGVVVYSCKHCGIEGGVSTRAEEGRMNYRPVRSEPRHLTVVSPPPPPPSLPGGGLNLEPLSTGAVSYLMERGISEETAKAAGVGSKTLRLRLRDGSLEQKETLVFPYVAGGSVYAGKARAIDSKLFTQIGSAQTLWLGEQVPGGGDLIIVEGEIDALSIREAGHAGVVSVPGGAPVKVSDRDIDPTEDRKFQFVWQAKDILEAASRVIIAVDNDEPGKALGEEIARRWGKERSWLIEWPHGCKDANDVLLQHGVDKLKEIIANPKPWPIEGIHDAKHYESKIAQLFVDGLGKGADPGMGVDEIWTPAPGMMTVITGVPGSGKSSVVNQFMVNLAHAYGWRSAVYSSETPPEMHIPILSAMHIGKPFFTGPHERMSHAELAAAMDWCQDHFLFLQTEETPTYQQIINLLKVAVMRYGIRMFVVDPSNYLAKPNGADPVEWVGEMLEAFKNFAKCHGCHAIVVAHPKKMEPGVVPGGYSISGSSHWFNRPDHGLTIHRSEENGGVTQVHSWKSRWSWLGSLGKVELFHDKPTGRFSDMPFGHEPVKLERSYIVQTDPWDGL